MEHLKLLKKQTSTTGNASVHTSSYLHDGMSRSQNTNSQLFPGRNEIPARESAISFKPISINQNPFKPDESYIEQTRLMQHQLRMSLENKEIQSNINQSSSNKELKYEKQRSLQNKLRSDLDSENKS